MNHAIVVAAGTGIDDEKLKSHGRMVFGGVPQLKRLVITAERAGINRFTIITEKNDESLKPLLENDHRIKSPIVWHQLGAPIDVEPNPSLILQSNVVITPAGLSSLMQSKVSPNEIALLVDEKKDTVVKTKGKIVEDLFSEGGDTVGAFAAYGSLLQKAVLDSMSLKGWARELIGRDAVKLVKFTDGYWMRLTADEKSAKKAEDMLFSNVTKSTSGWISRTLNSKISIPISRLLVRTPATPNFLSVMVGIIGMLSGVFYAMGHPVVAACFLESATILDRCDGEVARIKLLETKRGQWIDTIFDQLSYLFFIIGVPVGYYILTHSIYAIILGVMNTAIFLFFVSWSFYFLTKYTTSGSMVAYFSIDKIIPPAKRSPINRFIVMIRPMIKREFFSLVFVPVAIIGGYPWVLVMTSIAMICALIHQVDDIIKLRRLKTTGSL